MTFSFANVEKAKHLPANMCSSGKLGFVYLCVITIVPGQLCEVCVFVSVLVFVLND